LSAPAILAGCPSTGAFQIWQKLCGSLGIEQTLIWSAPGSALLGNTCAPEQSRCLPDYFSGASSERRPPPCTANPCASPLHQQVTEVSKSQAVRSCSAYNIASSALGETPMHARTALNKTGSGLQNRPRAPQNSPGAQVRLASSILHSPEMMPATKKSWFRRRTAEQPRLQDAAALQYINNNRSGPAAPSLCRFRYNSEVTPGETLRRNASEQRDGPCWRLLYSQPITQYERGQRPGSRVNCQTRARTPRAPCKFTEIYENPRAGCARAMRHDFTDQVNSMTCMSRNHPGAGPGNLLLLDGVRHEVRRSETRERASNSSSVPKKTPGPR
jgi:hypothetical protein